MHFRSKHGGDFKNVLRINKIFDLSDSYFPNPHRHFILILTLNFNIDVGTIKQNYARYKYFNSTWSGVSTKVKHFPRGYWDHFSPSAIPKCDEVNGSPGQSGSSSCSCPQAAGANPGPYQGPPGQKQRPPPRRSPAAGRIQGSKRWMGQRYSQVGL